jgi:hypothetical protein
MDLKLAAQAVAVPTVAVVVLSLVLVALPLPDGFFRDFGFVAGPAAWALCAVLTAKVLRLPVLPVLGAALVAGLVGTLVSLVGGHWPGVAGGLIAFGGICGWLGRGDRIRTGVIRRERPAS